MSREWKDHGVVSSKLDELIMVFDWRFRFAVPMWICQAWTDTTRVAVSASVCNCRCSRSALKIWSCRCRQAHRRHRYRRTTDHYRSSSRRLTRSYRGAPAPASRCQTTSNRDWKAFSRNPARRSTSPSRQEGMPTTPQTPQTPTTAPPSPPP